MRPKFEDSFIHWLDRRKLEIIEIKAQCIKYQGFKIEHILSQQCLYWGCVCRKIKMIRKRKIIQKKKKTIDI